MGVNVHHLAWRTGGGGAEVGGRTRGEEKKIVSDVHKAEETHAREWSRSRSRSPSPIYRRPGRFGAADRQKDRENVLHELRKNGFDYAKIESSLGSGVREEDLRKLFDGFKVDQVRLVPLLWFLVAGG